jgi:hypothetical protein
MKNDYKEGMDERCISYICNREACDVAWGQHVTARHLTYRLADRVGCGDEITIATIMPISAVIWGFYQGAKEAMKSVSFG